MTHVRIFIAKLAVWAGILGLTGCGPVGGVPSQSYEQGPVSPGSIQGRVCDPSGRTWLEGAMAYTYVYDKHGAIADTRVSYSDPDGYWLLDDLPGKVTYEVFVQVGSVMIDDRPGVFVDSGEDVTLSEPDCFDPSLIDVAVITGEFDDFALVLKSLGFASYTLVDGMDIGEMATFLLYLEAMQSFDVIFFNGGHVEEDIIYDSDASLVPDKKGIIIPDEVMANIRTYVADGGTVYATDWAYDVVELGWPEQINFVGNDLLPNAAECGESQNVCASVSDAELAAFLGTTHVDVHYELSEWPPIENVQSSVSVHMSASINYLLGTNSYTQPSSPILVSFKAGKGNVIYSTFRVAENATSEMVSSLAFMLDNL